VGRTHCLVALRFVNRQFGQSLAMTEQRQSDTDPREGAEPRTDDHHQVLDEPEDRPPTDKPEITDEHREKAKEMRKDYEEDRPTITMPGSGGAMSGTAVNEWIDDEGNPKFSDESEKSEEKNEG
jgi:hypothetical protein